MKVFIGRPPKKANKDQTVRIRIDDYDTWSVDQTLSLIIIPLLKKFREKVQSVPYIDQEDAPQYPPYKDTEYFINGNGTPYHIGDVFLMDRWYFILDEIIWAFEQNIDPDEWKNYYDGWEISTTNGENILSTMGSMNEEKRIAYYTRIKNGFRLFGKYYMDLWD